MKDGLTRQERRKAWLYAGLIVAVMLALGALALWLRLGVDRAEETHLPPENDALLTAAFDTISHADSDAETRIACVGILAEAAGEKGMVGGQVLDTVYDVSDPEGLTQLNRLKTGMMISGAVELGCVAAKMNAGMRSQALTYADGIGRAFQIRDDMLDVVGDAAVFGKPIGSDREEGKVTFVDVLGLDGCAREVERCTEAAKSAVANWSDHMFL